MSGYYVHHVKPITEADDPNNHESLFEVCLRTQLKKEEVVYTVRGGRLSAMRCPKRGTPEMHDMARMAFEAFKNAQSEKK